MEPLQRLARLASWTPSPTTAPAQVWAPSGYPSLHLGTRLVPRTLDSGEGWHWGRRGTTRSTFSPSRVGVNLGVKCPTGPAQLPAKWPDLISNLLEATPGIEPGIAVLQFGHVCSYASVDVRLELKSEEREPLSAADVRQSSSALPSAVPSAWSTKAGARPRLVMAAGSARGVPSGTGRRHARRLAQPSMAPAEDRRNTSARRSGVPSPHEVRWVGHLRRYRSGTE